jgi:cysteine desulfurase
MTRLYLDYNATAPLRPKAREAVLEALGDVGNASSVHAEGRAARGRVEKAREAVASLVKGEARNVIFTSGGTEANNTVLTMGWARNGQPLGLSRLLVGGTEHPSVLAGGRFPEERVGRIPADDQGVVRFDGLRDMLREAGTRGERVLVSVMLANNETGAIQPVQQVADLAHEFGAIVHSDTVQAAGRIPIDIKALGVDVLTLSSHKLGGPLGAGAIVVADEGLGFDPLLKGGGQDKRRRAGTEAVWAVAGMGAACLATGADDDGSRLSRLRDAYAGVIADSLAGTGRNLTVFSDRVARLPQTLCFAVEGLQAETLLIALDLAGVAVSSGSACSSGKVAPSHVLSAMGVPEKLAKAAVRLSLGWDSRESDLDLFSTAWRRVLNQLAPGATRAA